jgi:hypothetical protein
MNTVRWNISVSAETDQSLRRFLARQEGSSESDLSRFVEQAVRSHILNLTAGQAKSANMDVNESDLTAVIRRSAPVDPR